MVNVYILFIIITCLSKVNNICVGYMLFCDIMIYVIAMLAFYVVIGHNFEEQFEDTKGVIRFRKL